MSHKIFAVCLLTLLASALVGCGSTSGTDHEGSSAEAPDNSPASDSVSPETVDEAASEGAEAQTPTSQPPLDGETGVRPPTEVAASSDEIIPDEPAGTLDDPGEEADKGEEGEEEPVT